MTATRWWCGALAPSHAPGKDVLARGRRSQRGAQSKMRVHRGGVSNLPLRTGFKLSVPLSSNHRRAGRKAIVVDTNRNPRADIFAEPLEADIFAELRQPREAAFTRPGPSAKLGG